MKRLSIIIVTYNSEHDIYDCVSSIMKFSDIPLSEIELIIVDNNSRDTDTMFIKLKELYGNDIVLIKNTHNGGYGQGNNVGIKKATAPVILIMNPDVRLIEPFFKTAVEAFENDSELAMDIIDVQTGLPLKDEVKPNTACYVRVKNDTEEMLYVNVLNIDKAGNKYMVLPMDEEATCANLLIPAKSTVSFKTEPFITSDVPSDDAFVMVATEHPVNFSILMEPLKKCAMPIKDVKVGVTRRFVQTR